MRVVSATQRNLVETLKTGDFREDLYYRLGVVTIAVPPLRDRGSDIILLANYFLKKSRQEMKRPMVKFDIGAVKALGVYDWPGNVRELENRIKRAVVMSEGPLIHFTGTLRHMNSALLCPELISPLCLCLWCRSGPRC